MTFENKTKLLKIPMKIAPESIPSYNTSQITKTTREQMWRFVFIFYVWGDTYMTSTLRGVGEGRLGRNKI